MCGWGVGLERKGKWTKIQNTNKTKKDKKYKILFDCSAQQCIGGDAGEEGIWGEWKHSNWNLSQTQWNTIQWNTMEHNEHNTRNGRNGQEMGALSFGVHPAMDDYKALYASRELFEQVRCVQHFLPWMLMRSLCLE